jgi:ribonuclease-3
VSGEAQRKRLRALVRKAGISAANAGDLAIVERAFVHESYAKEHDRDSNERMEFLGDSVLGFLTASWLYEHFPAESEGALTVRKARIVNDVKLAETARRLSFSDLVELGSGMRNAGGAENTSILADAFEAFVAALYLTYGLEAVARFLEREHIAKQDLSDTELLDAKTRLQHYAQEHLGATPRYRDEAQGTPQAPFFASSVEVNGTALGTGTGPSKRAAQQAAAAGALEALGKPIARTT